MESVATVYGIDFSGDHNKWSAGCSQSNVWIASGARQGDALRLNNLDTVQALPGPAHPFERLSRLLNSGSAGFAAIDAPFSLPAACLPCGAGSAWANVSRLAADGRMFCRGADLLRSFCPQFGDRGQKMLRETERYWQKQNVNVRSTVWSGPRGGAPFAAACMTLLSRHHGPVWPFSKGSGVTLIEAFPAAQLRHWHLPHTKYSGKEKSALDARLVILKGLIEHGLLIEEGNIRICTESADALDAVICMFGAVSVASGRQAVEPSEVSSLEGHIAVHE